MSVNPDAHVAPQVTTLLRFEVLGLCSAAWHKTDFNGAVCTVHDLCAVCGRYPHSVHVKVWAILQSLHRPTKAHLGEKRFELVASGGMLFTCSGAIFFFDLGP